MRDGRCRRSSRRWRLALGNPKRPVAAIVGGAKVSTKLDLLGNLVNKVDVLIIGGGMANTFLFAEGKGVGKSLCEKDLADTARSIVAAAEKAKCRILLPVDATVAKEFKAHAPARVVDVDHVPEDEMILDIGPKSVAAVEKVLSEIKTLVWNGPFGAFETPPFDEATMAIAKTAARLTKAGQADLGRRRRRHGRRAQRGQGRGRLHLCLDRGRRVPGMDGRQGAAGRRGAEGEVASGLAAGVLSFAQAESAASELAGRAFADMTLFARVCMMPKIYTCREPAEMRTNIEIDDKLMAQAIKLTGLPTKRAVWKRACDCWFGSASRPGR